MAPKVKEAPAPPKAEAKAKALKAKKAVLKVSTATKRRRSEHHPLSGGPRPCSSGGSQNILERANKTQIKQAVKKLYDIDVAKVKTLIRPDREKKAYVHLARDYDALDVANKIGII
ncbi:large ribosomal subunit protein uL23-like [Rattus norvegicus]|uniref:large ribosomal subunit protein uL23-like n=1 Tax=Rattus norvegicus TaxID=10116 RepID=UPI0019170A7A|nr:60S ribosomal protein L23a-like [Rattus norvegicus]